MNHTNCQFRDKHTVGGIVFYKHAFLVYTCINLNFSGYALEFKYLVIRLSAWLQHALNPELLCLNHTWVPGCVLEQDALLTPYCADYYPRSGGSISI